MTEPELDNQHYKDLSKSVSNLWEITRNSAWHGEPYRHIILRILKDENQLIENRKTEGLDFDFSPLNQIINSHNQNYSWLSRTLDDRNAIVNWWQNHLDQEVSALKNSINDSRKLVLLVHGTAMLTSMTALGTIQSPSYVPSFLTVALGALLGFCVAVIGQVVWIEYYGDAITTLQVDFKTTNKMNRFRAYRRYIRKRWDKEIIWSARLTYLSVVIFPIYSTLAIVLALFSR